MVFPTQVGMFQWFWRNTCYGFGFPHAGGDVSFMRTFAKPSLRFSPRRWGCFSIVGQGYGGFWVFPTQVGMFLLNKVPLIPRSRFPHAGGDVSFVRLTMRSVLPFSPRRWGCFRDHGQRRFVSDVFPTQVGMFPLPERRPYSRLRFPHAGGDVSQRVGMKVPEYGFSPRRWGCFPVGEGGA